MYAYKQTVKMALSHDLHVFCTAFFALISLKNLTVVLNTASASKVGKFKPFLGGVKKTKRSADGYFCVQIQ